MLPKPLLLPAMVLLGLILGFGGSYNLPSSYTTLDAMSGVNTVTVNANDLAWLQKAKESTVVVLTPEGSMGSGVVVYREGGESYVVTAKHVVTNRVGEVMDTFILQYGSGDADITFTASLVRTSKGQDLALLKAVDPLGLLTPLKQTRTIPAPGDLVFAIGYPAGAYPASVSVGYFRYIEYDESNQYVFHSASIWYGNSGGALVNKLGELIGINVMMSGYNGHAAGDRGMAVPMEDVVKFLGEK